MGHALEIRPQQSVVLAAAAQKPFTTTQKLGTISGNNYDKPVKRIQTSLPGIILLQPEVKEDQRGFFFESYNERQFADLGVSVRFVQDNHSRSSRGTLRGLHYQLTHPQAKLCRVIQGEVLDVAVDIRRGSPTFGSYECVVLTADNRLQIFIPAGFAHGFLVLSESAEFLYKCSDFYYKEDERGILWDDPEINIEWGTKTPILSAKDRQQRRLSAIPADDLPIFQDPNGLLPNR